MDRKKKTLNFPILSLLGLIIIHGAINYLWLRMNHRLPVDDEATHLASALSYLNIFTHPSPDMLVRLARVHLLYPPLFPLIAGAIAWVLGYSGIVLLCMTNLLFLTILFFSLYFMGVKLGNKWSGVLAACFLSLYPMFFHLSRMFMLETALVCMVTLTLTLLLYSEGFSKRGISFWAGVSLGLGLLTKQTLAVFMIGPVIFVFAESFFSQNGPERKRRIFNLFLFAAVGVLVALPWYLFDYQNKYALVKAVTQETRFVPETWPIFSPESLLYYFNDFVNWQVLRFFYLAFLVSLILISRSRRDYPFFVYWILVPYAVLTLFPNKFCYYSIAYLPAVAFLTAIGFLSIKNRFLKSIVMTYLLFLGFSQFVNISFFSGEYKCPILHGITYSPSINKYYLDEVIESVKKSSSGRPLMIGVTSIDGNKRPPSMMEYGDNYILVNWATWEYLAKSRGLDWDFFNMVEERRHLAPSGRLPDFIFSEDMLNKKEALFAPWRKYILTDVFQMPDFTRMYLYALKKEINARQSAEVIYHKKKSSRFVADKAMMRFMLQDRTWSVFWKGRENIKWFTVFFWRQRLDGRGLSPYTFIQEYLPWEKKTGKWKLSSGSVSLIFHEGMWDIFWKGKKITRGLSVNTSMRSSGEWIDSRQCEWYLIKSDKQHIELFVLERLFPIVQFWEFTLEGHRIYWKVKVSVRKTVRLELEQTNIMLIDKYRHWVAAKESGDFPTRFNKNYGGDWDVLKEIAPGSEKYMTVTADDDALPKVTFRSLNSADGLKGRVIDSDDWYNGRVLQYVIRHEKDFLKTMGVYEYFSGYIELEEPKVKTEKV